MNNNNFFSNVTDAYIGTLKELHRRGGNAQSTSEPLSVGSCFGAKSRYTTEFIGQHFTVGNPVDRAVFIAGKEFNIVYAVAFSLWTLAGSDDLEFINFYNKRGSAFSDNNKTLNGAHGKRLFDSQGINQVQNIIQRLKEHPHSRRAVANIFQVQDGIAQSRDIPCVLSLQFLQRNNELHLITFMRSQSVCKVMPYDIFSLTFLQEAVARETGYGIGNYHHHIGSSHYYGEDKAEVVKILEDNNSYDLSGTIPQMPTTTSPLKMVKKVIKWENAIRNLSNIRSITLNDVVPPTTWPKYWQDIALVLSTRYFSKKELTESLLLEKLPPYYSYHLFKYLNLHYEYSSL